MNKLVIIDFMYLMHKHLYYVKQEEEKLLARNGVYTPLMSNPNTGEETARLYFALKDLEKIVMQYDNDEDTHIVVCADRKSSRKTDDENNETAYKANRPSTRFNELDIAAIHDTERAIRQLGIPVLGYEGYEADDIIQSIVHQYKQSLAEIVIYTPDADLAVLVDDNVQLRRYKGEYSKMSRITELPDVQLIDSHAVITKNNLARYFTYEYSKHKATVIIDYNVIAFYKATVGDPADNIKGITRFGNSAYMKLRQQLIAGGHWQRLCDIRTADEMYKFFDEVLLHYIPETQLQEVRASYELVRPRELTIDMLELRSTERLSRESRKNVYMSGWGINKI